MAVTLIPQFVVVPIASFLMDRDVWLPIFIGLGVLIINTLIAVILLPETLYLVPPMPEEISQDSAEETQLRRIFQLLEDSKHIFTSPTSSHGQI